MSAEILTPVRTAHRFDEAALGLYLKENIEGFAGPLEIRQFEGGQSNPTFLLTTPSTQYVLRKKPPGKLLPSAHMVEREYRILQALADTRVAVPKVFLLCEDNSIIGTPFFVMEYVASRLFRDPNLSACSAQERSDIYSAMIATLAALHNLKYMALGLADFGKAGHYVARQIKRWSLQYLASKTDPIESMDKLMEWLPKHIPDDDDTTLVHGDFRLDNLLFHPDQPEIVAVLDWELSTLGHPLSDLAYTCMNYHIKMPGGYLGEVVGQNGIPSEAEFIAQYCRHTGRDAIPDWNFYLAFSMFRYAAIVQGVHYRGLQGNASSESARHYGTLVKTVSDKAWALVQQNLSDS